MTYKCLRVQNSIYGVKNNPSLSKTTFKWFQINKRLDSGLPTRSKALLQPHAPTVNRGLPTLHPKVLNNHLLVDSHRNFSY